MILGHAPRYPENMVRLRSIYLIHPAELLPKSAENPAETVPEREFDYIWFTGANGLYHGLRGEKSLCRAPGICP